MSQKSQDGCGPSSYFLEPEPAYGQSLLLIARVLSHTDAKVQELNIEGDNWYNGDPPALSGEVFRAMSYMDMEHCCNAFRDLRRIKIDASEDGDHGWRTGNFAKI